METLNFSCTRASKLLLNWAGIMSWWDWTFAGDSWSFGSKNWVWLKEMIPKEFWGIPGEGAHGQEHPRVWPWAWLAGRWGGPVCEEPGPYWSLVLYWSQVPEFHLLALGAVVCAGFGVCMLRLGFWICACRCCSLTQMRNPPDTHFKLNPVITVGHGVLSLLVFLRSCYIS